jgi:hypothetical protein
MSEPDFDLRGLCADCQHCRIVKSERSTFYMCRRSLTEPEYRKYPPLPVLRCPGYERLALSEVEGVGDKLTE